MPTTDIVIPDEFEDEVGREVLQYSLAIGAYRDGKSTTFRARGAGTFVRHGTKYGILTAHHCIHADRPYSPPISIGPNGVDTVVLIFTRRNQIVLLPTDLQERELTTPQNEEFGPDLTFIEVLPGPRLDTLKSKVSFWSISPENFQLAIKVGVSNAFLAHSGFPELENDTTFENNDIHHSVKHMVYTRILKDGDVKQVAPWDYIESKADRGKVPQLPPRYNGVSGGGIWATSLKIEKDGTFSPPSLCLIGVTFYQTESVDSVRILRGHFIRSIYEVCWTSPS